MVQLAKAANTEGNQEVMGDFTPVPGGKYPVIITKSEYKETKARTGHYLQLQEKIIDGQYKGRVLFERLNLDNPNPTAVEIANKTLNTICAACGKMGVIDSDELHGIPMMATVIKVEATTTQPAGNDIKFYESMADASATPVPEPPLTDATPVATDTAPAPPAPADPAPAGKLPWEK